jgi:hypothetical protein
LGSELDPKNFSVFGLLGRKDCGPEVVHRNEPTASECIENVED